MARAIICDHCKHQTSFTEDAQAIDLAAWIHIHAGSVSYEVCSRACAVAVLESDEFVKSYESRIEAAHNYSKMVEHLTGHFVMPPKEEDSDG